MDAAVNQLNQARAKIPIRDLDVVRGTGTDWGEAVNNIARESGDMLLLGSGAAGPHGRGVPRLGGIKDPGPRTPAGHDRAQAPHADKVTITWLAGRRVRSSGVVVTCGSALAW
jgi:hypothetical protein